MSQMHRGILVLLGIGLGTAPASAARAQATWAPDSKTFTYRKNDTVYHYDLATRRAELATRSPRPTPPRTPPPAGGQRARPIPKRPSGPAATTTLRQGNLW